jgi:hypothetical protein
MTTLVFRLNAASERELDSIKAEAISLARSAEALSDAEFARLKPVFDRFFGLLARVNSNLVLVDANAFAEEAPADIARAQ